MFVIITRNFPPDVGGIQSLMEGLSKGLANHGPVKIFADEYSNFENYDQKSNIYLSEVYSPINHSIDINTIFKKVIDTHMQLLNKEL